MSLYAGIIVFAMAGFIYYIRYMMYNYDRMTQEK